MRKNTLILFQGDSITDCERNQENPISLGNGYVKIINEILKDKYSSIGLTIMNRGISGNRVVDLCGRWEKDCIAIKPDILTILIGINDCWRRYSENDPTSAQDFENNYRLIIQHTKSKLPSTKIILMEPFVLPYPEDRIKWREDLDPKIQAVRSIAVENKCFLLPLDGIFAQAATLKRYEYWAEDGVHPTDEGHRIIADEWVNLFKKVQIEPFNREDAK